MTRYTFLAVLVIGVLVVLLGGWMQPATEAAEQELTAAGPGLSAPMTAPLFGVTTRGEWGSAVNRQLAVAAGVRWARASVSWAATEPQEGVYNFAGVDSYFAGFQELGIIPIVFVSGNPAWAATTTCGPLYPDKVSAFGTFMSALAERYDGDGDYNGDGVADGPAQARVDYWSLYNEPDNKWVEYSEFQGCWGNYGALYAQLLDVAWDAVHQANPNGQLGISGLAAEPNPVCDGSVHPTCAGQKLFNTNIVAGVDNSTPRTGLPADFVDDVLNYMVAHPGHTYFDFLDFHVYPAFANNWDSARPYNSAMYGKAQHYKLRMEGKLGVSARYLLSTEAGRPSSAAKNYLGETDYEGNEWQSRAVVTTFAQSMRFGLRAVTWFSYNDFDSILWGLLGPAPAYTPKPSYYAYKTLTQQLGTASFVDKLTTSPGAELYVFSVPGVGVRSVIWASSNAVAYSYVDVLFQGTTIYTVDKLGTPAVYRDGQAGDYGAAGDGKVKIRISRSPIYVDGRPDVAPTNTPTPTRTGTPTRTFTVTATPTNTPAGTPTETGTPTVTKTPTDTGTPTNSPTVTRTPTKTDTPTVTNTPTNTATPTNTPTVTETPTVTPTSATVPLILAVTYQGHGASGTERWALPLQVTAYQAGTGNAVARCSATTDMSGIVTCPALLLPGTRVDVQVKQSHALSNKKTGIVASADATPIDMGTLLEGDADGNDRVDITDFSVLRTSYGQSCPACDARADFNVNGQVEIMDFSLLRTNYANVGPITVARSLTVMPDRALALLHFSDGQLRRAGPFLCGSTENVSMVADLSHIAVDGTAEVAIYVDLDDGRQADGADISFTWDETLVRLLDIAPGTELPAVIYNDIGAGEARIASGTLGWNLPRGLVHVATASIQVYSWPASGAPLHVSATTVSCAEPTLGR